MDKVHKFFLSYRKILTIKGSISQWFRIDFSVEKTNIKSWLAKIYAQFLSQNRLKQRNRKNNKLNSLSFCVCICLNLHKFLKYY